MNTLQTAAPKTLTIHTTLFDMLAAMQEEAGGPEEVDVQYIDSQIVSTVAEWMQSNRIAPDHANPVRSAA